uniref:Uncharacterized protein n=1 Tax=Oryza nivara TaxID=4536 RepID=A0A0E0IVX3_ORYNI
MRSATVLFRPPAAAAAAGERRRRRRRGLLCFMIRAAYTFSNVVVVVVNNRTRQNLRWASHYGGRPRLEWAARHLASAIWAVGRVFWAMVRSPLDSPADSTTPSAAAGVLHSVSGEVPPSPKTRPY